MKRIFSFLQVLFAFISIVAFGQNQNQSEIKITKANLEKVGTDIPVSALGEPAGSVKLYEPRWVEATENAPAYGVVEGSIFPVDTKGWPINFRILLPANWSERAIHQGGGGMNGTITVREGRNPALGKGFALYGSDSGHQAAGFGGPQAKPLAEGPAHAPQSRLRQAR